MLSAEAKWSLRAGQAGNGISDPAGKGAKGLNVERGMPEEPDPNPAQEPCGGKQSKSPLTAASYKDRETQTTTKKKPSLLRAAHKNPTKPNPSWLRYPPLKQTN